MYPKFLVRCWGLESTGLVFWGDNDSGSHEEQGSTVKRTSETRSILSLCLKP